MIIDEEHSQMDWFKYQGQLAAYPICAIVKVHGYTKGSNEPKYVLWDQMSRERIVSINGKPAMAYIEGLVRDF